MKRIPIGKKKLYFAVVDDEDFDRLSQFRWGLIRWRAYIGTRENRKWLGYFDSETDAAKAYDEAAIERYGEFARGNFS